MPADSRTNNAAERPRPTAWLLAALLAVAVLRLWRLPEAGPPDFDSVRNWQVVRELGQGNFANLFHHGYPQDFENSPPDREASARAASGTAGVRSLVPRARVATPAASACIAPRGP